MSGLVSRVLVAIPLIALAVYAAYAGGWVLAGLAAVTAVLAVNESGHHAATCGR